MKIALIHNGTAHQRKAMNSLRAGLEKHGHKAVISNLKSNVNADLAIVWSIKYIDKIAGDYIVLESGYINGNTGNYLDDRCKYVSFSINGLHGFGKPLPKAPDSDRWTALDIELKNWTTSEFDHGLVIKQHPLDAVTGKPYQQWLEETLGYYKQSGRDALFREHPLIATASESLAEAFTSASYVVTYCSTTAVEAVIKGLPTLTFSKSSIAWEVTSHRFSEPLWMGDRTQWANDLAYRQWNHAELKDGSAWEWMAFALNQ